MNEKGIRQIIAVLITLIVIIASAFIITDIALADTANVSKTDIKYTQDVTGGAVYFDASTGTITGCESTVTKVIIPDQIEGVEVTRIGYKAFYQCNKLVSLQLPDTITEIESYAFAYCEALSGIYLPENLSKLGNSSFYNCTSLTGSFDDLGFPAGVKAIPAFCFSGCSGLTGELTIPDDVQYIGSSAFENCSGVEKVTVPVDYRYENESLYNAPFNGCTGVKKIIYTKGKTGIMPEGSDSSSGGCSRNTYRLEYSVRENLESVEFREGVKRIGGYAFCHYYRTSSGGLTYTRYNTTPNLESVSLPNSLEEIGAYAFAYCEALSGIYLPENLSKLGNSSFYNCTSLTGSFDDLGFPAGVKAIPAFCFSGCSGLTGELTIPDDVQYIGSSAFENCSGVEKVTVPVDYRYENESLYNAPFNGCTGVKKIIYTKGKTGIMPEGSDSSSGGCSRNTYRLEYSVRENLESVEFREGVKRIGGYAFCHYYRTSSGGLTYTRYNTTPNLESVKLPSSLNGIGAYAFAYCDSLVSINILDRVNSIADSAFSDHSDNFVIYGYAGSYAEAYARENNIKFEIYTGKYKESVPKGKYGIFVVDSSGKAIKGADVEFGSHSGVTDINGLALFPKWTYETPLIKVSRDGYVTYSNENTNYGKSSDNYDIITLYKTGERKLILKYAFYDGGTANLLKKYKKVNVIQDFSLQCTAVDVNAAVRYEIWQNDKKIDSSNSGSFQKLSGSNFKEGKGVFVKVYDSEGNSVSTPINLEFFKTDSKQWKVDLGKDAEIKLPESIPVLGGKNISFPFFGDKLSKKIPLEMKVSNEQIYFGLNVKKFDEKSSESIKKELNNLKKAADSGVISELFRKNGEESTKSCQMYITGYGEAKLGKKGKMPEEITLYVGIKIKAKAGISADYTVVVVPVTVKVEVSGELGFGGKVKVNLDKSELSAKLEAQLKLKLMLYGGIGNSHFASGGIYGSGGFDIKAEFMPFSFNSVSLTLEAGVKAYIGRKEFSFAVVNEEFSIYDKGKSTALSEYNADNWNMYSINNYTNQDLSYLADRQYLYGSSSVLRKSRGIVQSGEINHLITTAYENSTPSVVSDGETMIMAYLDADTSRGANNAAVVKYSIYDKTTGTWGEPVKLDSNDTADYQPQLYLIGQDIYLIYQDCSNVYGDDDNTLIQDLVKQQNIRTAKFNRQTRKFEIVNTVDAADKYRSCQTAGTMNGNAVTAWVENSGGDIFEEKDIFNQNDTNEIWYSTYDGMSWSAPVNEITGARGVTALAVTDSGIAYVSDSDMDLNTDEDKELYIGGNVLDSGRISGLRVCDGIMMWVNDGILKKYDGNTVSVVFDDVEISSEFTFADNTLYYIAAGERWSNIYRRVYDTASGSWLDAVKLTSVEKNLVSDREHIDIDNGQFFYEYIEYLSVAELDGAVYAAFTDTGVNIEEDNITRKCALSWCRLEEVTDLTVEDAEYDSATVVPGGKVPVSVTVRNSGSSTIGNADVTVTDESGSTVYESAVNMELAAGTSKQIEVPVAMGDTISEHTYSISVNVNGDRNTDDNSIETVIGYTDFELECEQVQVGDVISLYMTVTNRSHAASSGKVEITCGDKCTYTADVPVLEYGESSTSVANLSEIALSDGSSGQIRVEAVADAAENETYNNYELVYLDLDYDITYYAQAGDETPFKVQGRSYDEYAEIIEDKPVREDYRLVGWSTDSEDKEAEYTAGDSISSNRNLTLYGVWQERTDYTVKGSITSYSYENAVVKVYPKGTEKKNILDIDNDGNVSLADDSALPYEVNVETPEADEDTYIQKYSVAVDAGEYVIAVYIPGYGLHIEDVDRNNRNKDISLYLLGDANGDGKVRIGDKAVLARYIAEWKGYDKLLNKEAADINGDGRINAADRMLLERHLAGWSRYKVLEYGMNTKKQ